MPNTYPECTELCFQSHRCPLDFALMADSEPGLFDRVYVGLLEIFLNCSVIFLDYSLLVSAPIISFKLKISCNSG